MMTSEIISGNEIFDLWKKIVNEPEAYSSLEFEKASIHGSHRRRLPKMVRA
jgi:hypothetical protein